MASKRTMAQEDRERLRLLERKLSQLILVVSIHRQAFQRHCLNSAFAVTTGSSSRTALDGTSKGVFSSAAKDFPIPSLAGMLENVLNAGTAYTG